MRTIHACTMQSECVPTKQLRPTRFPTSLVPVTCVSLPLPPIHSIPLPFKFLKTSLTSPLKILPRASPRLLLESGMRRRERSIYLHDQTRSILLPEVQSRLGSDGGRAVPDALTGSRRKGAHCRRLRPALPDGLRKEAGPSGATRQLGRGDGR